MLWRVWWPVSGEAGGRVSTNVLLRDLDLHAPVAADGRRLEVAVDGLPLFGGAQLAVDTTLVSALHCDGTARRGAAHNEGVAITTVHCHFESASIGCDGCVEVQVTQQHVCTHRTCWASIWWFWLLKSEAGGLLLLSILSALLRARARCEGLLLR